MTTTIGVKMADDSDIPPLEDMTEVLQKAELIREKRYGDIGQSQEMVQSKKEEAKKRAKVTKKNVENSETKKIPDREIKTEKKEVEKKPPISINAKPANSTGGQGMFGGMKKGFLFGGTGKSTTKPSTNTSATQMQNQAASKKKSAPKEDIPLITPTGNTDAGLTFNEVQQAMSEAKGLLDNQEWITDDFLNKIEKNETLLKRFSDPQFMAALQEFQTNPQAAMEKYKGNTEVEKFLMDFCGLLGDHFTKLGSANDNSQSSQNSSKSNPQTGAMPNPQSNPSQFASAGPKIVEIGDGDDSHSNKTTKPAISKTNTKSDSHTHIKIHDSQNGADIQEIPHQQMPQPADDDAVREVLNDPKVMETLTDPKVMGLIKTLKEDPEKGQRIIDKADPDLKDKVRFLVSKGLLQFQMS